MRDSLGLDVADVTLVDLGCGDGRVVIEAARIYGMQGKSRYKSSLCVVFVFVFVCDHMNVLL